ncbi:MAG TPA: hypothetical protein VHW01_04285, partial [Polyangiaceae bacterium]|nr:hypothetical protein [Polyangiaceae bacterium]
MSVSTILHCSTFRSALLTGLLGAALFTACVASPPGLTVGDVAGSAGTVQAAQGGSDDLPETGGAQSSDAGDAQGGADGGSADVNPQAGNATGGNLESGGGAGPVGAAGEPAQGNGGTGNVKIPATCPFHSDAVAATAGAGGASGGNGGSGGISGAGGSGGAGGGGPALTVTLQ